MFSIFDLCVSRGGSDGKASAYNVGDPGIERGGRSRSNLQEDHPEKGMATHSSILAWENPMDRGVWWASVHGVAKSQT